MQSNAHLGEVFKKFGEVLTIISLNFFLRLSPSSPQSPALVSSTPVCEWWCTRWCLKVTEVLFVFLLPLLSPAQTGRLQLTSLHVYWDFALPAAQS